MFAPISRKGWLTWRGDAFREEQKKKKKRKRAPKATLSFAVDDEEGEGEGDDVRNGDSKGESSRSTPNDETNGEQSSVKKKAKLGKKPNVDTSFLPDRDREEEERREREKLRKEWLKRQVEIKQEEIEITYSYWDGSGHRKAVTVSCDLVLQ